MKRREFITLLGGAAVWPLAARAQQPERMRRIGVLTPYPADEPEGRARLTAFAQALQQSGWAVGQNVQIDYRWGDGKPATMRKYAAELIALAARHNLPAVYALRFFVTAGGLMSYGTDFGETFQQAASLVDRILRGAKPIDLPVQTPTKYQTSLNLKTAKALGLTVPPGLLVAADEVIE